MNEAILDSSETVEGLEIQPIQETAGMDSNADMVSVDESMEQKADLLDSLSEEPVEAAPGGSGDSAEVSLTLPSQDVEQIVDALLQSDRVIGLFQSVEDTLQIVEDSLTALPEPAEVDSAEDTLPMVVVNADELLDKLEARQAETRQATNAAVLQDLPVPVEGGEITVIQETVQALLSYFQESDNSLLKTIRDNTGHVKNTVAEIKAGMVHPLMDTPFEQYSVTEGLLLILVLWLCILRPCVRMIKGGFSWLMY